MTTPILVKNINPSGSSLITDLCASGGILFFSATDGISGEELWRSDGTSEGTQRVLDAVPGAQSSRPRGLVEAEGRLFFRAFSATTGEELWQSDGSAAGTTIVKDINPGLADSNPSALAARGERLFFITKHDRSLWTSDGSPQGTQPVFAITNPVGDGLFEPTVIGDTVFFSSFGQNPYADFPYSELWALKPDQEESARSLYLFSEAYGSYPKQLTELDQTLFFQGASASQGFVELWASDGTPEGTRLVKDINNSPYSRSSYPAGLTVSAGQLFFSADDGFNGRELWASDGSEAGTVLVQDIRSGSYGSNPDSLVSTGDALFFVANDGENGYQLWTTTGSFNDTTLVKLIGDGSFDKRPAKLIAANGMVYFVADDGIAGRELWRSDGTAAGTERISDINPGLGSSNPDQLIVVGQTLFFTATDGNGDSELWSYSLARSLKGTAANDSLIGTEGADQLLGEAGNDTLFGADGDDLLDGGEGDDRLVGGSGADQLIGGAGNDIYVIEDEDDTIVETTIQTGGQTGGIDEVILRASLATYTLGDGLEHARLEGSRATQLFGNSLANLLSGNAANNLIDGGGGADQMAAGLGDDTYVVDSQADLVRETENSGNDQVNSLVSYNLPANIEQLNLIGSGAINGTGNTLRNRIFGGSGANVLDGGSGGRDQLTGLAGADRFRFSSLPKRFNNRAADRLLDVTPSQGDRIQISRSAFGLATTSPSLTTVTTRAAAARALASPALFVYNRSSGALLWNQNGSAIGDGRGGVLAVLPNQPSISASLIELL